MVCSAKPIMGEGHDHMIVIAGAILVFLPGYDEIISLRDRIQDDKRFSDSNRFALTCSFFRNSSK